MPIEKWCGSSDLAILGCCGLLALATLAVAQTTDAQEGKSSPNEMATKLPVELIFSKDHFTVTSNSELRLPIRWINHSDEQLPCSQSTSTKIDERYLYD